MSAGRPGPCGIPTEALAGQTRRSASDPTPLDHACAATKRRHGSYRRAVLRRKSIVHENAGIQRVGSAVPQGRRPPGSGDRVNATLRAREPQGPGAQGPGANVRRPAHCDPAGGDDRRVVAPAGGMGLSAERFSKHLALGLSSPLRALFVNVSRPLAASPAKRALDLMLSQVLSESRCPPSSAQALFRNMR
jgi:hypothetical protein